MLLCGTDGWWGKRAVLLRLVCPAAQPTLRMPGLVMRKGLRMPTMSLSGIPHDSFSHVRTLTIWSARVGGGVGQRSRPLVRQAGATRGCANTHAWMQQPECGPYWVGCNAGPTPSRHSLPPSAALTLLLGVDRGVQTHVVARVQRNLVAVAPQLLHQVAVRLGVILDSEPDRGQRQGRREWAGSSIVG